MQCMILWIAWKICMIMHEIRTGGIGAVPAAVQVATPSVSPVRYVLYPWIATVTQGYTASIEGGPPADPFSTSAIAPRVEPMYLHPPIHRLELRILSLELRNVRFSNLG